MSQRGDAEAEAEADELTALLSRCRPFVLRAMNGGKAPHAQDQIDAAELWPLIKDLASWRTQGEP